MNEMIFQIEETVESGIFATALGASIVTHGEDRAELRSTIRDAVACHIEESNRPRVV